MKNVLVLYYSQTGQLERVLRSLMQPFEGDARVRVHFQPIVPERVYPFPWPVVTFFDQFPECVQLVPPAVDLPGLDESIDYDLIVLGYQTWYLSPSLPATGLLKSRYAALLRDKPVVTVIGCRNMWYRGQLAVRQLIDAAGGRFAGIFVREDQGTRAETFITVTVWLLTGRRETWKGVLSPAGVSDAAIADSARFGRQLLDGLHDGRIDRGQAVFDGADSAPVDPHYVLTEEIGWRGFRLGAGIVRLAGGPGRWQRVPLLGLFALCLGIGIVTIVPFGLVALAVFKRSARYQRWLDQQIRYLQGDDLPRAG